MASTPPSIQTPTPSEPPAAEQIGDFSVADVFGVDDNNWPFGGETNEPEPAPAGTTPPAGGDGVEPPASTPSPTPEPTPSPQPGQQPLATPAPTPVPAAPDMATLQAQVEAQAALIRQLQGQVAPAPSPTPTPAPAQPGTPAAGSANAGEEDLAQYQLAIPPDIGQAIFGEDQNLALQALGHLVSRLGTTIHTRVRQEMDRRETVLLDKFGTTVSERELATERQKAWSTYYQAFPNHNKPGLAGMVQETAQQIAAENPNIPFNADFVNALGARVNAAIAAAAGLQPPAPAEPWKVAQQPQPTPKPPAFLPANSGSKPSGGESQSDMVMDVLGWSDG